MKENSGSINLQGHRDREVSDRSGSDRPGCMNSGQPSRDVCSIQSNEANTVTGTLPDGKGLDLVIDSGASLTVLSSMYIESSEYLRKLPRERTKLYHIRIADGSIVESTEI